MERWKAEMPTEAQMQPRDKYTMFDRKEKRYRKGIHSMFFLFGSGWGFNPVMCMELTWVVRTSQVDPCVAKDFSRRHGALDEVGLDFSLKTHATGDHVLTGEVLCFLLIDDPGSELLIQ